MVRLEIRIPPVRAERCAVTVVRFKPTRAYHSEVAYAGEAVPGQTVVVKELHSAVVAKKSFDPRTGEYGVEYYEPVEYAVIVDCSERGRTPYVYARIHQVFPRSLVWTHRIEVSFSEEESAAAATGSDAVREGGYSCVFGERRSIPGGWMRECVTWVEGPYLYSINGVETSFGIEAGLAKTAVYLEGYGYSEPSGGLCSELPPRWESMGRKEAVSIVTTESESLSGNRRDRLRFNVRYAYERYYIAVGPNVGGRCVWLLYPVEVLDVRGVLLPEEYRASGVPAYAAGPTRGDRVVYFVRGRCGGVYQSDYVIASTPVTFAITLPGVPTAVSWTLSVDFYRAGRCDGNCVPPYVRIRDVSGRTYTWYRWWFRDDDPMTFELILYSHPS